MRAATIDSSLREGDMERLSGLDAGYLYLETPTSPMHVSSLLVLDPSTAPGGFDFDTLRSLYLSRLHRAASFRRRLVEVPLGIHHPVWVEDPDFDIDWHLRHIAVPAPGTREELNELVGHLIALPLDRTRPLWESWLIEGVEGDKVALLTKVHHAAIDGQAGDELIVSLLDVEAPSSPVDPSSADPRSADSSSSHPTGPTDEAGDGADEAEPAWTPEHVPSDLEMFGHAMLSLATQPWRVVKTTQRTAGAALRIRSTNRATPTLTPPPLPFTAPRTSFNQALTPHRSFVSASVSLDAVKAVKDAYDVKVNDVVLALCAGSLRRYLDRHDEHPDGSLVAMVPTSVRSTDRRDPSGNRIAPHFTDLATLIDDPVERLQAISTSMAQAEGQHDALGADTLRNWADFAAPAVVGRAARLYSRMHIANHLRPAFNLTISNVPGPAFPLYLAGAQVVHNFPAGPVFDGCGLNITVTSSRDRLDFGLIVCPELISDPDVLAAGLHEALDELTATMAGA